VTKNVEGEMKRARSTAWKEDLHHPDQDPVSQPQRIYPGPLLQYWAALDSKKASWTFSTVVKKFKPNKQNP